MVGKIWLICRKMTTLSLGLLVFVWDVGHGKHCSLYASMPFGLRGSVESSIYLARVFFSRKNKFLATIADICKSFVGFYGP